MSKSNTLFKKKKKRTNIRENDILCWDHFKQVLVRHFINLGKQSATHNNHWRQFTIHLNEDWTEAPFLSLKLKWRFHCFFFKFSFSQKLHCVFIVYLQQPISQVYPFPKEGHTCSDIVLFQVKVLMWTVWPNRLLRPWFTIFSSRMELWVQIKAYNSFMRNKHGIQPHAFK